MGLQRWWREWQRRRALARRAIPDPLWDATLARFPFLAARPAPQRQRLRDITTLFLDRKEFTGANGFKVTDEVAVAIAAQACLPILQLGLELYDGFVGIVVQPGEVVARRQQMDDDGVVHLYDEVLVGEAMEGGPVMLSWPDVAGAGETAVYGFNVVIHEFVHKLDMLDGASDGVPALSGGARARQRWLDVMQPAYEEHLDAVEAEEDTFLDPYGAHGPDEFFAVAAEAFFVAPQAFRAWHPELHALFRDYFRQDPADAQAQAR